MKNKLVLITGGCGFIGTSLIRRLLEIDPTINIRIIDNLKTGTEKDLKHVTKFKKIIIGEKFGNTGVTLIEGDIRDRDFVNEATKNTDCIIHLAANTGVGPSVENPLFDMECNVRGTLNLLEAARFNTVKKFIFASSGAPAGEVQPPIHEELPPHPVSPYGASKLAGEGYCSAYFNTFGINTICLRFGNVYGPLSKRKSSVVAKFIRESLQGKPCTIFGDGTQTRDFIYIVDLVEAIVLSMEKEIGGETFQIATGKESSVHEVSDIIKKELHKRGRDMKIDFDLPRLGDVMRNYSDTSKAQKILGWNNKTPLKLGISKTVDYFIDTCL